MRIAAISGRDYDNTSQNLGNDNHSDPKTFDQKVQESHGSQSTQPVNSDASPSSKSSNPYSSDDPRSYVHNLSHDGDSATFNVSGQAKVMADVPVPYIKDVQLGAQGQYGWTSTVTQHGDGPKTTYTVSMTKREAAGLIGEKSLGGRAGNFDDKTKIGLEINGSVSQTTSMTFNSKTDAERAIHDYQQLATQQTVQDAAHVGEAALHLDQVPGFDKTTDAQIEKLGPSPGEVRFLQAHTTSVSQSVDLQLRLKGQYAASIPTNLVEPLRDAIKTQLSKAGLPSWLVDNASRFGGGVGADGRLDGDLVVTRAVTFPHGPSPGQLSYSIGGTGTFDPKLKAEASLGPLKYSPQNIMEVAQESGSFVYKYNLTPQQTQLATQSPLNDTKILNPNRFLHPNEVDFQASGYVINPPALNDVPGWIQVATGRDNQLRGNLTISIKNPRDLGSAMGDLGALLGDIDRGNLGQFKSDAASFDKHEQVTSTAGYQDVHRTGHYFQQDFIIDGGVVAIAFSPITDEGNDLVQHSGTVTLTTPPNTKTTPPPTKTTPPPTGQQVVVMPYEGVNVRSAPGGGQSIEGTYSEGTFLATDGTIVTDPQGTKWLRVTGPDTDRKTVQGWVAAQYVAPHNAGAENATGRVDQSLRNQGYIAVEVQPGDTVDSIAARYGVDPSTAVAVNQGHVIDPNLIFAGDTIYVA